MMIDDIATITISYLELYQLPIFFNQRGFNEKTYFKIDASQKCLPLNILKYMIKRFSGMLLIGIHVQNLFLEELLPLINVKKIEKLFVYYVKSKSLEQLVVCINLKILKIQMVNHFEMKKIKLNRLRKLELRIGTSGNINLGGMYNIKFLILDGITFTVEGGEYLKKIKYMKCLCDNNGSMYMIYNDLSNFVNVVEKNMHFLDYTKIQIISCDGLVNICGLKKLMRLESITIFNCWKIKNIDCLNDMKNLKFIDIRWCFNLV